MPDGHPEQPHLTRARSGRHAMTRCLPESPGQREPRERHPARPQAVDRWSSNGLDGAGQGRVAQPSRLRRHGLGRRELSWRGVSQRDSLGATQGDVTRDSVRRQLARRDPRRGRPQLLRASEPPYNGYGRGGQGRGQTHRRSSRCCSRFHQNGDYDALSATDRRGLQFGPLAPNRRTRRGLPTRRNAPDEPTSRLPRPRPNRNKAPTPT